MRIIHGQLLVLFAFILINSVFIWYSISQNQPFYAVMQFIFLSPAWIFIFFVAFAPTKKDESDI